MIKVLEWLTCNGDKWHAAIEDAATELFRVYRARWPNSRFVNLYDLAASLDSAICFVTDIKDGARLLPVRGGFRVLVNAQLHGAKFRFAVAHELAHTLFYSRDTEFPAQLQSPTKTEENFCSDLARRLLAPRWLVDDCRLSQIRDGKLIFSILTDRDGSFRLSKPVAARVMLSDYRLASGVAGLWEMRQGNWMLKPGMAYATHSLRDRLRKHLRSVAMYWLKNRRVPSGYEIIGVDEVAGESAFVVVLQR